ncbi:arylesterase [Chelativorans sp. AA-79]|uniref:arylesterase n=1 Tax=Chelativorans sp. AA-79 TaxID=3028735 RepID=UPI0023F74408|nr:arylesterase [Chelativorans sp. AA-79]WEX09853.1 arylesterase [Chelativorans sp. AA-79]
MAINSLDKFFGAVSPLAKILPAVTAVFLLVAAAQPARAEPFSIVGFGDSLMAGYELAPDEGFTERLEAALREGGYEVTVANAGVSGDATSGGLSRLDWSVPDGTDLVVLELGANDMLRGLDPASTERNLSEIVERLQERGIGILLLGMYAAPNLGPDYQQAFNGIYPRLAEKYDLPLVPFFLEGVAGNASLQLADGMHPNAAGIDRMVQNVLPEVQKLIREQRPNM